MKIIFINPPKNQRKEDHVVNMALFWLVSILENNGIPSKVYTVLGDRIEDDIDRILKEANPEIIGITCKWWNTLYSATLIAEIIKKKNPNVFLFTGGHTATIFASQLVSSSCFDAVLLGDSEISILELAKGNCKHGVVYKSCSYDERKYENICFLKDTYRLPEKPIEHYIDRPELVMAYVWIGRGCSHNCFYCAENVDSAKRIFKERIPFVRCADAVADDINKLGERSFIIFDYEYPSFDQSDNYIEELSKKLNTRKDYRLYFFSWGIPSKRLIDVISSSFSYSCICIDIQCFSESLRKTLSSKGIIKPFVSDQQIVDIIKYTETKNNVILDATGIVGYPFETEIDRKITIENIMNWHSSFQCVRDFRPSPLHTIPGTTMVQGDNYYDLTIVRRTYEDFYLFTKESFYGNLSYYSIDRMYHPYGNFPKDSPKVIPDYMNEVNRIINKIKSQEIKVECQEYNDKFYIFIEDKYSPLISLIQLLQNLPKNKSKSLKIELGKYTWFHHSFIDYTSESGENCATLFNMGRSIEVIREYLTDLFSGFKSVELCDYSSSAWGIIREVIPK